MPRSDRLFRLLHLLRSLPSPVTAERLAVETEVSVRSVYRDIAALRASGARIEGEAGFGYVMTEDPALPPQTFTRIEIEALLLGLSEAQNAGDSELAEAARMVLAKITARLPERQQREIAHAVQYVYRIDRRVVPQRDLSLIRRACWDEQVLHLSYADEDGHATSRDIWPLMIGYGNETLVILAWCCVRQDFRRFRIERIASVHETGESFRPRRVGLLNDYVRGLTAPG
jgi:predicted DNA-binding transcriptional regulator YafY